MCVGKRLLQLWQNDKASWYDLSKQDPSSGFEARASPANEYAPARSQGGGPANGCLQETEPFTQ